MTDDTTNLMQQTLDGETRDEEPTSDEIKRQIIDRLGDADGAFVVTAELCDDDDDGENDAVALSVARFVDDDVDGDDAMQVKMSIAEATAEHGLPGPAMAVDASEGLGGLLDALMSAGLGPDSDDDGPDDDDSAAASMFQ